MRNKLVLALALLVVACTAAEENASSESAAATTVTQALDCSVLGSFPEAAMKGVGDATYVRAGAAAENSLRSFTLGPLEDIPGWGGKHANYTRADGQTGQATVMMDNPAIGAFLAFEKDVYFVTASQVDATGKVSALCLANAATGDRFLVTRQEPGSGS